MKKLNAFIFLTIILLFASCPPVRAEHILSLVYSGVEYTASQAADPGSGYPYIVEDDGDTLYIKDDSTGIEAEIINQTLSEEDYKLLRDYYNDAGISNEVLFSRFVELKKSYITALESRYNTNYLSHSGNIPETAMKIFYSGQDTLFGLQGCSVYLYNITRYEGLHRQEKVYLDLIIPVNSTSTVIIIKFTIPQDKLGSAASKSISGILSNIRFNGLYFQSSAPAVLSDLSVVENAKSGIYPAASQAYPSYTVVENLDAGYSLYVPSTYVPYIQNNLGGEFTYSSYKINPNQIFSISSEPLKGNGEYDAISRFKVASLTSIEILDSGTKTYAGNSYTYLVYSSTENGIKQYYYDYYIKNEERLFKLQLQSAIEKPGSIVLGHLTEILESFKTKATVSTDSSSVTSVSDAAAMHKYTNNEEGYSFLYPKSWRLEDISSDIEHDRFRLVVPGLSGALDITVQESSLKKMVTFVDLMKSVSGKSISSWPNLTTNYNPPFAGLSSKLLYSDFTIDGPVSTIYRQSVFMDENGRNRLCYSVDIINGGRINSMFITAGEYKTSNGSFTDAQVNALINSIAASFKYERTPESDAKRSAGEFRNRKVVFVEKYLKRLIDPKLVITSVQKTQQDKTFYVTVGNSGESGYYKIKLDYENKKVEILNTVLTRNILHSELLRLKSLYENQIITSAEQNEANMTITIKSRNNLDSALVTRTYRVDVSVENSGVSWKTTRLAHQEDYMWECGLYIQSLFSSNANVYFSSDTVFKDLEQYRQKNLKYRFMTYAHSRNLSGFMVLLMDHQTSLFASVGGFIPLDTVVDTILDQNGLVLSSKASNAVRFDPETFTLTLTVSDTQGGSTEVPFYVYYNMEKGKLEYERIILQ